jgi:hypothetical protein
MWITLITEGVVKSDLFQVCLGVLVKPLSKVLGVTVKSPNIDGQEFLHTL